MRKVLLIFSFTFGASYVFSQNVAVDVTSYSVEELVKDVLIASPCANVSNITWLTGSDFGEQNGIGYFSEPSGVFPFNEGLLMASSSAMSITGPNTSLNDLSEGSMCAFYHNGMLLQRRGADGRSRFDQIDMPLGTVAMAVAASSAFPGFFPPLELRSWEVGAREGDFSRQAFTDGGIYDNLGLRMFHHLQHSPLISEAKPDDQAETPGVHLDGILVSDAGATFKVRSEGRSGQGCPLGAVSISSGTLTRRSSSVCPATESSSVCWMSDSPSPHSNSGRWLACRLVLCCTQAPTVVETNLLRYMVKG